MSCFICNDQISLEDLLRKHHTSLPPYPSDQTIRQRAYAIRQASNQPACTADDYWHKAEQSLYRELHVDRCKVLGIYVDHFSS